VGDYVIHNVLYADVVLRSQAKGEFGAYL